MAEPEDEDGFPNDFDGLDFDNIPGLQAPPATAHQLAVPSAVPQFVASSTAASPVPSTESSSGEVVDDAFFTALDAIEARALGGISRGKKSRAFMNRHHAFLASESSSCVESDGCPSDVKSASFKPCCDLSNSGNPSNTTAGSCSRWYVQGHLLQTFARIDEDAGGRYQPCEYTTRSPELPFTSSKGKRKAEPQEDIRAILAGYEAELTCPICCDLFVGAQVANPCGHTCCGACGDTWLTRNKYEPTCVVCRSSLSLQRPLLPNFTADNAVQQHLRALAKSGRPEWQERGYKTVEWNKRLESWKQQAASKAAKEKSKETARLRRRRTPYYDFADYAYMSEWSIDADMIENDLAVAHMLPRRGARSRR